LTVDALYKKIITAGALEASNLNAAEAFKVIENTRGDAHSALIHETDYMLATVRRESSWSSDIGHHRA